MNCLLNPKSLVVKEIGGKVVRGKWLHEYIVECWDKISKKGWPTGNTMMEVRTIKSFSKAKKSIRFFSLRWKQNSDVASLSKNAAKNATK